MGTVCVFGNTSGTGPGLPKAGYGLCGLTVVVASVVVSTSFVVLCP